MPAVKIAIDIRRMTEFGVGTYIRNVVRTLGRLDHENEFLLIGSPAKVEEIGDLDRHRHPADDGVWRRHLYPQRGSHAGPARPRERVSPDRLSGQGRGDRPAAAQLPNDPAALA